MSERETGPAHECLFAEEQEPEGRLILGPCLSCGNPALEALEKLKLDVKMWSDTAVQMARDLSSFAADFEATGNSRPLGDPAGRVWHEAARLIRSKGEVC